MRGGIEMTGDGWRYAMTDPAPMCVKVLCMGANGGVFIGERMKGIADRFMCSITGAQSRRAVMWHPIPEPLEWMGGEAR